AWHARAHCDPRRSLEDVRDDRLALRLRRRPRAAPRATRSLLRQLDLLRPALRPARRGRRSPRPLRRSSTDAGGVQAPPPADRRRPERTAGYLLPPAGGRLLCLPE